jgi:branched-chain amino acid aminotransferase
MQTRIDITLTQHSRLAETDFEDLPFGKTFSDHMFIADYEAGEWKNFRIVPYGAMAISPSNMALHYGQSVFEGMKANKNTQTDEVLLFRPDAHLARLNRSLDRLGMPLLPENLFMDALKTLLEVDKDWIPTSAGAALYLRPVVFASDEFLGVRASDSYKFVILTGPTGAYYSKPVRLLVADAYVRAFAGGTGFAKCAGNYAATIKPARLAREQGFDQILWMDGAEFKYLQESGTMNIFAVIGDTVLTPPATETILAGITRDSIIKVLQHLGKKIEERPISIDELLDAHAKGELREMFGAGTAAVISHVSEFSYKNQLYTLPSVENRPIGKMLKATLEGIKDGSSPDYFGWTQPITANEQASISDKH